MNCAYCGIHLHGQQVTIPSGKPKGMPRKEWKRRCQEQGLTLVNQAAPTRDHTIPQCQGGRQWVWSCYGCNHEKGGLTVNEFRIVLMWRHARPIIFAYEWATLRWFVLNVACTLGGLA